MSSLYDRKPLPIWRIIIYALIAVSGILFVFRDKIKEKPLIGIIILSVPAILIVGVAVGYNRGLSTGHPWLAKNWKWLAALSFGASVLFKMLQIIFHK